MGLLLCCHFAILMLDIPEHHELLRNVRRFRWHSHNPAVESSLKCGGDGHCDKRSRAAVQLLLRVVKKVFVP